MTTWPQNTYFVASDGASYLAHQSHAGVAIALGDPVARSSSPGANRCPWPTATKPIRRTSGRRSDARTCRARG
ncbi:hypothetical protein ACWEOE_11370 [Amycolatopsis sp. NPDC004368]